MLNFLNIDENKPSVALATWPDTFQPSYVIRFSNPVETKNFILTPGVLLGVAVEQVVLGFHLPWLQYRQPVGAPVRQPHLATRI